MKRQPTPLPLDRDVLVQKHSAVPEPVFDEVTGQYEGEDLARMRARRPTPERISRLERRVDKLDKDMAVGFAQSQAQLATLLDFAAKADAERERRVQMEAADRESKRKHLPSTIKAVGAALALVITALLGYGVAR